VLHRILYYNMLCINYYYHALRQRIYNTALHDRTRITRYYIIILNSALIYAGWRSQVQTLLVISVRLRGVTLNNTIRTHIRAQTVKYYNGYFRDTK